MNHFMEIAEDARGPRTLGEAHQGVQPEERQVDGAAHPLADVGLEPHGPGRVQQRHAHLRGGDGGGPRAHPVAAHQRAGRGDRPADGLLGSHRPQHADLPAGGNGHHEGRRPVGGQLLRRAAHARVDAQGLAPHPGDRVARRHGQGHRDGHPEDAHRRGRRAPAGPHRLWPRDHRRREQVPTRARTAVGGARGGQPGRAREPAETAGRDSGGARPADRRIGHWPR